MLKSKLFNVFIASGNVNVELLKYITGNGPINIVSETLVSLKVVSEKADTPNIFISTK